MAKKTDLKNPPQGGSGVPALSQSSAIQTYQGDFVTTPKKALQQLQAIQSVVKDVMKEGEHYGTIPGVSKPSLFKPGAELLNNMYGFALSDIDIVEKVEQWDVVPSTDKFPLFRYLIKTTLVDATGRTVATGIGECNSYESKYRFRGSIRKCPECQKETIIKGKKEYGGGWICFGKKGGCGAKFDDNDVEITSQPVGKSINVDIFDIVNTILKMAKKRSYIDGTLSATRTSGLFTQDVEDFVHIQNAEFVEVRNDEGGNQYKGPVPQDEESDRREPGRVDAGSGVEFKGFDPSTEVCTFGKQFNGEVWAKITVDYLTWMVSPAAKVDKKTKEKALATLDYKKKLQEQEQAIDPFEGALDRSPVAASKPGKGEGDEKGVKTSPRASKEVKKGQETSSPTALLKSLQFAIDTNDLEKVKGWWTDRAGEIQKLSIKERSELQLKWIAGKKSVREKGAK
jgi:hypothetical protein